MQKEKLLSHVERIPGFDCWIWNGAQTKGYGQATINKKHGYAHRLSFEIFNETTLSSDDVVMHKCDVPLCINPDHLSVGTHLDNVRDKISKGRARTGSLTREENGNAKINSEIVNRIRSLHKDGMQIRAIAKIVGCSKSTVWLVANHKTWSN